VVVDSGSRDRTEAIARGYPNVVFVQRPFTDWGSQWRFAMDRPEVDTPYALALDADMVVSDGFTRELRERFVAGGYAGGRVRFAYAVGGRRLLGSLYPPDVRLFHRDHVTLSDTGHRHVFEVDGPVYRFRERILHDDRKGVDRFLRAQMGYAEREARRIRDGVGLRFRDRLRRAGLMAPAMFLLAWVRAGAVFRGRAALRYAHERSLFEAMLALRLMDDGEADDGGR
jgi:hypothetical protein